MIRDRTRFENRSARPMVNAFSVDVEEHFQVTAFEKHIRRDAWDGHDTRVVANTHRVLELLEQHQVRGTFYVLGWVADRHPDLVREIHDRGHEIGSHSYWHRLVYQQSPQEFREDLRRSLGVLGDILGKPIRLYRAPSFSITAKSLWALEILVEEGITTDSSVFPTYHDRYGIPSAREEIYRIQTTAGTLWEFPPTVFRLARIKLPVGGGGYFRLYPLAWTNFCLKRIGRASGRPFMVYVHPWELDPDQPDLRVGSRLSRFRHYVNLAKTPGKLHRLLGSFRFGTVSEAVGSSRHDVGGAHNTVSLRELVAGVERRAMLPQRKAS